MNHNTAGQATRPAPAAPAAPATDGTGTAAAPPAPGTATPRQAGPAMFAALAVPAL